QQGGDLESVEVRGGGTECDAGLREVCRRHFPLVSAPGGYHEPVMVAEVLSYLKPERGGLYFDGTVGGGGHAEAMLRSGAGVGLRTWQSEGGWGGVAWRRECLGGPG